MTREAFGQHANTNLLAEGFVDIYPSTDGADLAQAYDGNAETWWQPPDYLSARRIVMTWPAEVQTGKLVIVGELTHEPSAPGSFSATVTVGGSGGYIGGEGYPGGSQTVNLGEVLVPTDPGQTEPVTVPIRLEASVDYAASSGVIDLTGARYRISEITFIPGDEMPREWGTNPDRQQHSTKDEDPTGLQYFHHRYYEPETGVFMTRDPLGFIDGPNMYTYVSQDPWTKFDPLGLEKKKYRSLAEARMQELYEAGVFHRVERQTRPISVVDHALSNPVSTIDALAESTTVKVGYGVGAESDHKLGPVQINYGGAWTISQEFSGDGSTSVTTEGNLGGKGSFFNKLDVGAELSGHSGWHTDANGTMTDISENTSVFGKRQLKQKGPVKASSSGTFGGSITAGIFELGSEFDALSFYDKLEQNYLKDTGLSDSSRGIKPQESTSVSEDVVYTPPAIEPKEENDDS